MYRWTDPSEPDGVPRRPAPPTAEGPSWLTDRPEPRSSYLFGDEPEEPDATRVHVPADPPSDSGAPWRGAPVMDPTAHFDPVDHPGAPIAPFERAAGWRPDEHTVAAWRAGDDTPVAETGRHRQRRRFRRPLVIGGAAAAATLVVSLGVGALALPGGDRTERTSADEALAAAPAGPSTSVPSGDAPAPASPTAAPSPSRTATPKPSRTTAPSRQLQRSSAPRTTTPRSNGLSAELQQVVDLVNKERAKAGCRALAVDDKLVLAAQRHSQDQADHRTMSHDGSDGSDAGDRLDRVGYAWRAYGENVAWNQQTPAAVMDAWMNSPGHRANILNCSFTEIGVGVARSNGPYWTQDFGTPR